MELIRLAVARLRTRGKQYKANQFVWQDVEDVIEAVEDRIRADERDRLGV
jgi:hypothetical protein